MAKKADPPKVSATCKPHLQVRHNFLRMTRKDTLPSKKKGGDA